MLVIGGADKIAYVKDKEIWISNLNGSSLPDHGHWQQQAHCSGHGWKCARLYHWAGVRIAN
jgi:hypothetical protein